MSYNNHVCSHGPNFIKGIKLHVHWPAVKLSVQKGTLRHASRRFENCSPRQMQLWKKETELKDSRVTPYSNGDRRLYVPTTEI